MVSKVTPDTMLSASRLPAVMGLSKYRTPNDELQYSINALQGNEREDISNESMGWGNQMEPLILAETARRLQLADLVTEYPEPKFHDALPLCCSLDGTGMGTGQLITNDPDNGIYVIGADSIVLDGIGVLEAKLTAQAPEDEPPLWRGPIQLQAQMDIVKAKWGAVATLYQGTKLHIYLFAPHEDTLDAIDRVSTVFQSKLDLWKETGAIDYYPPQNSKDADRTWPNAQEEIEPVPLGAEAENVVDVIIKAKDQIKDLNDLIEKAETKIKETMGSAGLAKAGKYMIKWGMRSYKAQPEKIVPAKEAYTIRQSTLTIKKVSE